MSVLRCSLEECLKVGSADHHQWNGRLLDELIDRSFIYNCCIVNIHTYSIVHRCVLLAIVCRASMEGPLWCQVLQQFITALESSLDDDDRVTVLPDFLR